ncbi:glucosamine-6-phosphate deaminase [Brachybacterium hainanense]|uniref:Glucosamine-6-phosphate deaminase n=1 Tax=Brachybacterium hainanense TaxID=1541174 RepID=A0ABV6RGR1_9MICO
MEIVIASTPEDAARIVADRFEQAIAAAGEKGITLGLATGSSPVATYQELIRRHQAGGLSFAHARAFLLDEYVGLPRAHEQSYYRFIRDQFTAHVDIDDAGVLSPNGEAADPVAAAAAYDAAIGEAGGVDLQILGIGSNGHIGFNEPTSSLSSRTRVKTLTRRTVEDNARFFDTVDQVPVHVITQGLGTIGEARRIVLIATGEGKADAVAAMVEGALSAFCPASSLQLHPAVTVVLDEAAASKLENADYYRFIQEERPRLTR